MFGKLARSLAVWYAKLKHWHALWQVGTFIDTLARKNDKLARFWHAGKEVLWHSNTLERTLARKPR